jgi:hypothetical protein
MPQHHPRRPLASFAAAAAFATTTLAQTTVTLVSARDNTLYAITNGSLANGAGEAMFSGFTMGGELRRCLVAFDVAAVLPPGATVTAASLQLFVTMTASAPGPMSLHRATASWGEGASQPDPLVGGGGGGGGGPAAPGDATWLHRFHPNVSWSSPGGDHDPNASATLAVNGSGFAVWASTPQLVADVQSFLDTPAGNHGWLVRTPEQLADRARRFATREHANALWRPQLTITYLPAPATFATFGAGCAGSAGVPTLAAQPGSLPQLGSIFQLVVGNLAPTSPLALGLLGISTSFNQNGLGSYALPLALDGLGMPGCAQRVSADLLLALPAGGGIAPWPLPIANVPTLVGLTFYVQALAFDAAANPFGAVTTNSGSGIVGP